MRNFDLDEFRCKHCGCLPENGMNPVLLEKLDELRDYIGQPIYVSSGYRCPYYNEVIGGVSNSQHVQGNAADIICNSMTIDDFADAAREIGFDGLGVYYDDGFLHVDCRDDGESIGEYNW